MTRDIAERCSRPNPKINELTIRQLRPYIESFIDHNWLNDQLAEYERWAVNNSDPILQRNLLHRPLYFNMLVAAIWATRSWEKIYHEDKYFRPSMGPKRLLRIACSLAVLELHAGAILDSGAREHIQQRLQAHDQLWGLIHECNTFTYFIQKGINVEPLFLKKANQQEIVLRWNNQLIPVQCKCKPPGAGRAISQENFTTLAGCVVKDLKLFNRKLIVRINSTGQIRSQDIEFLREQIRKILDMDYSPYLVSNDKRTFCIQMEKLTGETTIEEARRYLTNYGLYLTMGIAEPKDKNDKYEAIVVIGIDAKPDEYPWSSLERSIKDGARQLKGGSQGIIAIHYVDHVDDFEQLQPDKVPIGFKIGELIRKIPQVGAVMLSTEPDLQLPDEGDPGHCKWYYKKEWPFLSAFSLGNHSNF